MANILVTGDRGFIGRYLVTELLDRGHYVVGLDDNSKHGLVDLPNDDNEFYMTYYGDATDKLLMNSLIEDFDIDVIVSAAALIGGIKYFHDRPFQIIKQNSELVHTALKSAIENDIEQVVMLSSSMVYEQAREFPVKEGQELEIKPPLTAYGFQKLESEYACRAAKNEHDLDYTIIRPFNAVGAGEEMRPDEPGFSHVIPDFIYKIKRAIENNENEISIFGDGEQIRCFTHARDISRGIADTVLNKNAYNEDFNFTTEQPITMKNLAKKIWAKLGGEYKYLSFVNQPSFENDVLARIGDHQKAKKILGWEPQYNLDEILEEMINEIE